MRPLSSADVIVLGAGPAGLGAAWRLAQRGLSVTVLEREPAVGGLAASFDAAGVRVDHGSHRLHPATPAPLMRALAELLGADLQRRPRRGRILLGGRYVAFPPRALELVRRLPPALSARLARDVVSAPLRRPSGDTFAAAVRAGLGPTMLHELYGPYVEKLFGVPAEGLAAELARRRVGARDTGSLVRRVVRPHPDRGVFYYPRRGFGQIPAALADAAVAAGATILTGEPVAAVRAGDDAVEARTAAGDRYEAGTVLSSLPLPALARLAGAPDYVTAAADRLESRALVLVYLALPVSQWSPFDAHYFPDPRVVPHRVSEPKNYRSSDDDPPDVTVLCAEVPCAIGDATWSASTAELAGTVRESLARVGLPIVDPFEVTARRVAHAYPVYRAGFEDAFETLDGWAARQPRLLTFGRQGLFAHDNTHHTLATAWAAADSIDADGRIDEARWRQARHAFASHVVED